MTVSTFSIFCDGRSGFPKDGEIFLAWTKDGNYGMGKREGTLLYFNGKREDLFNNPIARWLPLPKYYSDAIQQIKEKLTKQFSGLMA